MAKQMKKIVSNIDIDSEEFHSNVSSFQILLEDYFERLNAMLLRSHTAAVQRHVQRGKLTVRERIDLLIDPGSHFLEISAMAANGQYNNEFPYAGIVTGIGIIHGKESVIIANDATVKAGTYIHETIKKHVRALEIALTNHLPSVFLVDSGGVYLPEHTNVFPDRDHFGRIFYLQAQLSANKIPQVAVVMGSCTAGGAYVPAMSDE